MTDAEIIDNYAIDVAKVFGMDRLAAAKRIEDYLFLRHLNNLPDEGAEEGVRKHIDKGSMEQNGRPYYNHESEVQKDDEEFARFMMRLKSEYARIYDDRFFGGTRKTYNLANAFLEIGNVVYLCERYHSREETEQYVKTLAETGSVGVDILGFIYHSNLPTYEK